MWVSELLPRPPAWSTICASSAACTPRRSITSRPSRHADRQPDHRPALPGHWASYGLGSLNDNLPTFVVLVAKPTNTEQTQAISAAAVVVGLSFGRARRRARSAAAATRSSTSTIRPESPTEVRREHARWAAFAQRDELPAVGDPETHTRIEQYELAFRMQSSVPELTDHRERA